MKNSFLHDSSVAIAPSSLTGAYNTVYLATALRASAQIPSLRLGTSDTPETLSEIMLRQVTIHLYPIIISNLIGAKK